MGVPSANSSSDLQDDSQFTNSRIESHQEFDRLLEQHREQLVLFLVSLVQNTTDAEDLCQKCCVIMWQKFEQFDRKKSFLAWACGIAKFEVFNFRRARSVDRLLFHSDVMNLLAISLEMIPREDQEHRLKSLKKCVESLPDLEQSFIRRIYWEGCSFETIAQELSCARQTFYNRMYLLRRRVSRCVLRRLAKESRVVHHQ